MGRGKKYIGMSQRPDGTWRKSIYVDGRRVDVYGQTQKEAEEKAIKKRIEIEKNGYRKNEYITFGEYFDEWLKRKTGTVAESTIYRYTYMYKNHIRETPLHRRKVQKIEHRELVDFQRMIAEKTTIKNTNDIMSMIYGVMKLAVIDEIIARNPAANIPRLKTKGKKTARETIHRALTREEIHAFLKEAEGSWYYNAFRLMLATGLRVGECCALEWGDIDHKKEVLHIRRTITRNAKGEWIVGNTTKTEKSTRDIPLNAEILKILRAQWKIYIAIHGDKLQPMRARLFENSRGGLIIATTINDAIKAIEKKANIKHFSVHALRDTFATMAIMNGMQPNTLKEILGHEDIGTTMNIYTHVYENEKKKAMKKLRVISL